MELKAIDYTFHDFRTDGLDKSMLEEWLDSEPPAVLINKRSTSWKQLPEDTRRQLARLLDERTLDKSAVKKIADIILDQPTLLKRPVVDSGNGQLLIGYDEERYQAQLG